MVTWVSTKMPRLFNGVMIVFPTNGTGTTGHLYAKKKKRDPPPMLHIVYKNSNSEWIIDFNVKSNIIRLQEDVGGNLEKSKVTLAQISQLPEGTYYGGKVDKFNLKFKALVFKIQC